MANKVVQLIDKDGNNIYPISSNPNELLDMFYPVGSYYETSNTSFDPNISWGGTWVEDTWGRVTVAYQSDQPLFDQVGEIGGTIEHGHGVGTIATPIEMFMWGNSRFTLDVGDVTTGSGEYHQSRRFYTENSEEDTSFSEYGNSAIQNIGTTALTTALPPYIVVKRWHRTA